MLTVHLNDPTDPTYPFPREWYDNDRIIYHGTSSISSPSIEQYGFTLGMRVVGLDLLRFIIETYKRIGFVGSGDRGYGVLAAYSTTESTLAPFKAVFFSQDYWIARNYSRNPGGEEALALRDAATEYREFIASPLLMDKHRTRLLRELEGPRLPRLPEETRGMLAALANVDELRRRDAFIQESALQVDGGFPVVYACAVQPEWFRNWSDRTLIAGVIIHNVDLSSALPIPADCLLGRAVFPNGVSSVSFESTSPLPLPWDMERYLAWKRASS